ncbi:gamma-glutamylcyclotransferase [Spongisporangium articulatum]|uniref:Gamma-glutamylcyclotransferase n=1 Tax=Spongisporangium articulatum TaxID=3362603 RepID=A0ABW8AQM1_9ACTN
MALYAAYGSNLDPESMALRAPHSPLRGTGWLNGWRLTFSDAGSAGGGAFATLVEDGESQVYVSLYDVTPGDESGLDEWEGLSTGVSTKVNVRVQTLDGDALAWVHVLDAYEGGLPTARYLFRLADAAEAGGAPADYVAELRSRPCSSDDAVFPPQEA